MGQDNRDLSWTLEWAGRTAPAYAADARVSKRALNRWDLAIDATVGSDVYREVKAEIMKGFTP